MTFRIAYKNSEEIQWMRESFERGPIRAKVGENEVEFTVEPADRMVTILLGSQPARIATRSYVEKLASLAKEYPNTRIHLFAFCADHMEGKETLLREVSHFASSIPDYPKNLSIVPFSFQNEAVIAPLFYRSDATCTRSGGQTAMELMCVSTGEIWIHSEANEGQDVLKGIPGWEAASALYLQKLKGAKIVTPAKVAFHARGLFQRDNRQALANRQIQSMA